MLKEFKKELYDLIMDMAPVLVIALLFMIILFIVFCLIIFGGGAILMYLCEGEGM
jgi:hypothetical protein